MKKVLSIATVAAMALNMTSVPFHVLADEQVTQSTINPAIAKVAPLTAYGTVFETAYNDAFQMPNANVKSITTNAGSYPGTTLDDMLDNDPNTHWETTINNSATFTNELVFEFEQAEVLEKIGFLARSINQKGFPEAFEIYASETSTGDTFQLVSTGSAVKTGDFIEMAFAPTTFKRLKFVFKKANVDRPFAAEFRFYKEDTVSKAVNTLFTDNTLSQLRDEYNNPAALAALEESVQGHPLYDLLIEKIEHAKFLLNQNVIEPTIAKVASLPGYGTEFEQAYNDAFQMPNTNVQTMTANGGIYPGTKLEDLLDNDPNTHWETLTNNSAAFTNELVFELEQAEVLNRIGFLARSINQKGFPEEFEIYASETSIGDTFQLVSSGSAVKTGDFIEMAFEPTTFKRLKFVFKKADSDRPFAAEFRFYKEDTVSDTVNTLFTDNTLSQVRDEYNNLASLVALEEKVQSHPLNDVLKAKIEHAKLLVNQNVIEPTIAKVALLPGYGTEFETAYNDAFQMPNTNVQAVTANGGTHISTKIENMLDNDPNTHWETETNNSESFTNELVFDFEQAETLNRLAFLARSENQKGFPEEFEIYASETSVGDTFQLVSNGKAVKTGDFIEMAFEPTTFKRLKFVFKKADVDRPFAAEFRFYKEDTVQNKMNRLFTDGTMSDVSAEFNTISEINALEEEAQTHPLYQLYKESFELAKKIVNGELVTEGRMIVAEQHGNRVAYANNTLKMPYGNNNQPTGIAAKPGEKITVYVEADTQGPLPQLVFTQHEASWSTWAKSVNLMPGKNEIIVPTIYTGTVTPGGPIYISNPYDADEQTKAPIIRVEGGDLFPIFTKNTDVEEFRSYLIDYKKRLDVDKEKHPNEVDRELVNVVEIVSDRIVFTGTATDAYDQYITNGLDPLGTVNGYDVWINQVFEFTGFDKTGEVNDPKYVRENIRLMQPLGAAYAAHNHTGIQRGTVPSMFNDFSVTYPGWGLTHEIGHRMAVTEREYGEVTNNMVSMAMSIAYDQLDNRIPFEKMYGYLIKENDSMMTTFRLEERLAAFWQLELAYPGYWAEFNKLYREREVTLTNGDISKQQYMIEFSSDTLKQDLSSYFARHGFTVTEETKQAVSKYPAPKKIWYLNNSVVGYTGNGFTTGAAVNVGLQRGTTQNTLTLSVNTANKDNVLGYEILRNGELIGFTSTATFVDQNIDLTESYRYEVIAYDKKLNTLQPVAVMVLQ